ncbi:glycine betaine ABC transporter substrate-binding protein [Denitromonas iodatirespirans]|uniref:Glycine betaine ABC transporter substrate-binding protein n=1 Tax=Denitromonas iodatirespirans TaxID=2795389 RepID=A0A944DHB6_DENI1|nr:glycine betaine ABC transporter substrate-binding protein [Denitromonas iodatirespirans]MBT0964157.1 glycine betaine ABC transporter substrate-binding protein [Denitromonas iodatirespirans]
MFNAMKLAVRKFAAVLAVSCAVAPMAAHAAEKTIKVGWTAWSDAEAVTNVAKQLLEKRLGYKVELVMADVGIQYNGVAKGDLDVMLMSWLPTTHQAYWEKVSSQVEDLGILYDKARLGWVVPDYVPESEVKSIEDLKKPEIAKKFKKQIQGIDAGSGLMRASAEAVKAYGLDDYKLVTASDAAMVLSIDRAIKRDNWIVATSWAPHWMFAQYKLRFLEDPKKTLGGEEAIHAVGRMGFEKDFPKAAAFIKSFKIPLADLQDIMLKAKDSSYEKEAAAYIESHPEMVEKWLKDTASAPN